MGGSPDGSTPEQGRPGDSATPAAAAAGTPGRWRTVSGQSVQPERTAGVQQTCVQTRAVNFSFCSVHFVRMKLQFSSIPYSLTIGHGDHSVRLVEFDQKVIEPFRPWYRPVMSIGNQTFGIQRKYQYQIDRYLVFLSHISWHFLDILQFCKKMVKY